jgi:hypothetical protein
MNIPTAVDILYSIEKSLESVVAPTLTTTAERSCVATISHMLRHVSLRIEQEGQNCLDDIAAMEPVLVSIRAFCERVGTAAADACGTRITVALDRPPRDPLVYPTLQALSGQANEFRLALQAGLDFLIACREQESSRPGYHELRQLIREYLAAEIQREGLLIHPAFENRGPRR